MAIYLVSAYAIRPTPADRKDSHTRSNKNDEVSVNAGQGRRSEKGAGAGAGAGVGNKRGQAEKGAWPKAGRGNYTG
eukprot:765232-Hanusia_phi.AAC.3